MRLQAPGLTPWLHHSVACFWFPGVDSIHYLAFRKWKSPPPIRMTQRIQGSIASSNGASRILIRQANIGKNRKGALLKVGPSPAGVNVGKTAPPATGAQPELSRPGSFCFAREWRGGGIVRPFRSGGTPYFTSNQFFPRYSLAGPPFATTTCKGTGCWSSASFFKAHSATFPPA